MPTSHLEKLAIVFLVFFTSSAQVEAEPFKPTCPTPSFPSPAPAQLVIDQQCGVQGEAQQPKPETDQNLAKNNFCAGAAAPITIPQMRTLQAQVQSNSTINFGNSHSATNPGPAKDRSPLRTMGEGELRVLEGYVLIARQEGKEMVNCETTPPDAPASHDIHISIVETQNQVHGNECESVVAEMSPHHRPDVWNEENVQKVALAHKRVRLTGQLFFDSSHSPCSNGRAAPGDPHRSSLWEIHPIYKFDVCPKTTCAATEWVSLDKWLKAPGVKVPRAKPPVAKGRR